MLNAIQLGRRRAHQRLHWRWSGSCGKAWEYLQWQFGSMPNAIDSCKSRHDMHVVPEASSLLQSSCLAKTLKRLQGVIHISDWYATLCTLAGADYVDHAAEKANKILRAEQLPLLAPVVSRRNMYRVGNLDMGHCLRCTFDMSIVCFQQSLIFHLFNLKS